jgi:hypothetical protein
MRQTDLLKLNVARAKDRVIMAQQVAELAAKFPCVHATIVPEDPENSFRLRERRVELRFPHGLALDVEFDGDCKQQREGCWVLSWHTTRERTPGMRLNPAAFSPVPYSVNPHHGLKATDVVDDFLALLDTLELRFERIQNGMAYLLPTMERV